MGSALRAKPSEDELAFAKNPPFKGSGWRPGNVVPFQILNVAAFIANEMVMLEAFGVETSGASFHRYFAYQACPHKVIQIVIGGGAGRARVQPVYAFEDFYSCGVPVVFQQESHYGVALRSAT